MPWSISEAYGPVPAIEASLVEAQPLAHHCDVDFSSFSGGATLSGMASLEQAFGVRASLLSGATLSGMASLEQASECARVYSHCSRSILSAMHGYYLDKL